MQKTKKIITGAIMAAYLTSCSLDPGAKDNDNGPTPDTTAPTVTLELVSESLVAEGYDGSGLDLSLYVDKDRDGEFQEDELIERIRGGPDEDTLIEKDLEDIDGLNSGTDYDARAIGIDRSEAKNESYEEISFTTPSYPDQSPPYSPSVTAATGTLFGEIDLEMIINGDDDSNQSTEEVSGIVDTKLYAMPINSGFTKEDLETYGTLLDTFTEEEGTFDEKYTLPSNSSDYAIFSVTRDNESNKTLDFETMVRAGGPDAPLPHRFLGSIDGYTSGNVEVFGVVGGHREKIDEYTPEDDGTIDISIEHYVSGENLILSYQGSEKSFTYERGELDMVEF